MLVEMVGVGLAGITLGTVVGVRLTVWFIGWWVVRFPEKSKLQLERLLIANEAALAAKTIMKREE